jgi:hypothetical protein
MIYTKNKYALQSMQRVLRTKCDDGLLYKQKMTDRERLDAQRTSSAHYYVKNFSREERYLQIFARDFAKYLLSSKYLLTKDTEHQLYFYFLCDFDDLSAKMKEFGWTPAFLKSYGINYKEIRKLYFAVA